MKQKKSRKVMGFIGLFLMVISIAAFVWYEWLGGREWTNYTKVVVLTEDVIQGQLITSDKLAMLLMEKETVTESAIMKPEDILNKAARHFIPKHTALHENFFESPELVLEQDEYIAQIPVDWTLSIPNTLRRGDEIIVYAATYSSTVLSQLQNTSSSDSESSQVTVVTPSKQTGGALPAVTEDKGELTELFRTSVAYVKDGSNKEVVNASSFDRLDGSSSISTMELIVTTEEFEMLEEQIKLGAKLIIMYTDYQNTEVTALDESNEE